MVEIDLRSEFSKPGIFIIEGFRHLSEGHPAWNFTVRPHVWRPPTDVYETEEGIVVRIEIAGMNEEDFSIIVDGKYLSIRGLRSETPERRAYYQMEIRFGEFVSDIELPFEIDLEKIEAIYQAGFLRILLPRKVPKHISIQR